MGGMFAFTTRSRKDRSNPGVLIMHDSNQCQMISEVEKC
jgi:hypothetical protein